MTYAGENTAADLLGFAAPGLLHGLGNNLFSINGHAQMLGGGKADLARQKSAIVKASEKALHALAILRYLVGEPSPESPPPAGVLIQRLFETLRVPLHEAGLQVQFAPVPSDVSLALDGEVLCQSVVTVLRALAIDIPEGLRRAVAVGFERPGAEGAEITFRMVNRPSFLPFPVDFGKVIGEVAGPLQRHGARLQGSEDGQQLSLHLPPEAAVIGGGRAPATPVL